MKRFICLPIMSSLLMSVGCQVALSQSSNYDVKSGLITAQTLSELNPANVVKVAELTNKIDEETALNLVWKLPQVQRKAREIAKLSRGTIKLGAVVDGSPTENEPYYTVRIFENQSDYDSTIYWFRVFNNNGLIEVLDVIENKYISLDEWQQQLKR
ncbi:hypothetical protein H6G80_06820 [Nostoc sp. FACHB-87]|uniref:hypothetical protein n=1 Tax=Nostocales TaxID=1161 RepID=UPI00168399D1|nr:MULTISPECIES: hypothetical protein [Nostocales]MBD2300546.1 hypothetical protein [Nostoc sp. FACHB-190]MBD2453788.1 hypothetical protein [Nostoc sp. FACHB-87]MBD2475256.1 hypothetical protein [Anabaena sp. FACHB-83]MBD2488959.1 hypothetical protein [Aulosira sp. FACHB-615]